MPKFTVQLRGGFSDRNKIKCENTTMQIDDFDHRTRVALRNITNHVLAKLHFADQFEIANMLMSHVYGCEIDYGYHYSERQVYGAIYSTIAEDTYDSILTVLEYIVKLVDDPWITVSFEGRAYNIQSLYNLVFEQEYVGYRFVDGIITPITNQNEIMAIEEAVSSEYDNIKQHFEKALHLLSDRESPDYANSIKESITAVESMCTIILGKKATLGEALKKLESAGVIIHGAMKGAFEKLYGYTSDANGIRHAGELGGPDSTFEEAKFMLVSCSAFVNYLTGLQAKYNSANS